MAAMKHGKSRKQRQGPVFPGAGRGDRDLREMLAKEYGVEAPPRSFHKNFEKTLSELPEDMPVRRRPVFAVLRSAATAVAVLAVTFASLLGVNTTYPQLTEALPGLGQVFQAMNSGQLRGNGRTPDLPEATPEPEKVFQPVTVEGAEWGIEDLRVDDAWCDGGSLCLELSLGLSEEFQGYWDTEAMDDFDSLPYLQAGSMLDYWDEEGKQAVSEDYSIQVSMGGESYTGIGELSDFITNGEGRVRAVWRVELDEYLRRAADSAEEIEVSLSLPAFTLVLYGSPAETIGAGFQTKFTVPVDASENRRFTQQASDNGAALTKVDYTPGQVEIEMELPFIGYYGDMLIYPGGEVDIPSEYADYYGSPLGIYPALEGLGDQDTGYTLARTEAMEDTDPGSDTRNRMRFVFRPQEGGRRAQAAPLRLTVYELPGGEQLPYGRVVAEQIINLDTGRVTPGENYLAEGREKVDTARDYLYSPRGMDSFTNGFLCSWISMEAGAPSRLNLVTPYPSKPRTLLFNGWSEEGELVQSIPVFLDLEQPDQWYGDQQGWSCQQSLQVLPGSGEQYLLLQIELWETRNMTDEDWDGEAVPPIARMELLDGDTGRTLIDDLSAAYESARAKAWGGPVDGVVTETPGNIAGVETDAG